jgi:hypothetical protein
MEYTLITKNTTKIILTEGDEAVSLFCQTDTFIENMSPFDLQARLHNNSTNVCHDDYFDFVKKCLVSWSCIDFAEISETIAYLNTSPIIKHMEFPSTIYVLLTNGEDESNAAYCRNNNCIILPLNKFSKCTSTFENLANGSNNWNTTFIHELFHIWSRNNTELRDKMYKIVGYEKLPVPIDLPSKLKDLKMTNPDAPLHDVYIQLSYQDKLQYMCPVLHAKTKFDSLESTNFFDYLDTKFLFLDDDLNPTDKLASYDEVTGLYEKIGNNTDYIIHPEEILADNFVFLIQDSKVPNQEILEAMKELFCTA